MENCINSDIIRGHIDTIILNTLVSGDKYVTEIENEIVTKSNGQYEIKQATLYSSLKRLETEKCLKTYWKDVPEAGRRRYYNLTAQGNDYIKKNLENWNYSRKIINELLSVPHDEQVTIISQKAEIPPSSSIASEISSEPSFMDNEEVTTINNRNIYQEKDTLNVQENKKYQNDSQADDVIYKESTDFNDCKVNYKKILGELVSKTSVTQDDDIHRDEISNLIEDNTEDIACDKSFVKCAISNNKINLTDLVKLSEESGLKIRVSSKDKVKDVGNILTNKLSCVASWSIYFILLAEIIVSYFSIESSAQIPTLFFLLSGAISLIFPIIMTVIYVTRPKKSATKLPSFKLVLTTSLIIIFNVALIFCAIALLGNVNLNIYRNLMLFIVFPIILLLDVPMYFIVKYRLVKTFKFYIK